MKKLSSIVLSSAIVMSGSAFAYTLNINNTSTKDLIVTVFQKTPVTVDAGKSKTVDVPSWDYNVSISYQGKWSPQGFLQVQRASTYDVISSQPQACASGRANLKTTLESGIDKNSYLLSTASGSCSLDGGNTCKIAPNSESQADINLLVSGADC
jgi:hypothetical protein